MKIDRNLNLVIPVEVEPAEYHEVAGKQEIKTPARYVYVHAAPVSVEMFEENAWLFARVFKEALEAGNTMGPRIAAHVLRKVARDVFGPNDGQALAITNEIRRLSMVISAANGTYQPVPFDEAVSRGLLDREDAGLVENVVTFFTLSWRIMPKADRMKMTLGLVVLWGGLSTSLNSTDYARSLTTSTPPGSTGGTAPVPAGQVVEAGRTSSLPS